MNMKTFLSGLDRDIQENLKQQLSVLWTHASNAIEGSTLTLGETDFVIREGITISGKPLKDFKDAESHYNAIGIIYKLAAGEAALSKDDLFTLHKTLITDNIVDIYKPKGAWKLEPNGTYQYDDKKKSSFWVEYPTPEQIPSLMKEWILFYNSLPVPDSKSKAVEAYNLLHTSFVCIHPFYDGNGRMARLVANIPVIRGGFPPITIDSEHRQEYISILGRCHLNPLQKIGDDKYPEMEKFIEKCWAKAYSFVKSARQLQDKRNSKSISH